jgi:hypothetical protein
MVQALPSIAQHNAGVVLPPEEDVVFPGDVAQAWRAVLASVILTRDPSAATTM